MFLKFEKYAELFLFLALSLKYLGWFERGIGCIPFICMQTKKMTVSPVDVSLHELRGRVPLRLEKYR